MIEQLTAARAELAAAERSGGVLAAQRLMDRMRRPGTALTRRETQVLQLVADGLSNQEISKQLYLSQATVKTTWSTSTTSLPSIPAPPPSQRPRAPA